MVGYHNIFSVFFYSFFSPFFCRGIIEPVGSILISIFQHCKIYILPRVIVLYFTFVHSATALASASRFNL